MLPEQKTPIKEFLFSKRSPQKRAGGSMMDVLQPMQKNNLTINSRNHSNDSWHSEWNNSMPSIMPNNKKHSNSPNIGNISYGLESSKVNKFLTNRKQDYDTNVHIGGVFKSIAHDVKDRLNNNRQSVEEAMPIA